MLKNASIRYGVVAAFLFVLSACKPDSSASLKRVATVVMSAARQPQEPKSDSTYERFMDEVLRSEDIAFSDTAVENVVSYEWDKELECDCGTPDTLWLGEHPFRMDKMRVVNEDGDRLYQIRYWEDTAFLFKFRNRRYGWARAGYFQCNGSGCLEDYYFLADFSTAQLHAFVTFAVPHIPHYFGDINSDGHLDFLIPDASGSAYGDETKLLTLTAYTLSDRGRVEPLRYDGKSCELVGQFDGGIFAPRNFRIVDTVHWFRK